MPGCTTPSSETDSIHRLDPVQEKKTSEAADTLSGAIEKLDETIHSHRGDAYELVLTFFDKGGDEREKMKAHIREQEQLLKRLEIEANEEKDPAKKR